MYVQSLEIRSFDPPITRILVVCIENTHFADFSWISFWRKDELRYQNFLKNIYISATVNTHKTKLFSSFHGYHSGAFSMEKNYLEKARIMGTFWYDQKEKLFWIICKKSEGELTQMLRKICFRKAFLSLKITENSNIIWHYVIMLW